MSTEMKLPELGEGVLEGELIRWRVKVGDSFKPDQTLCEVMTDKATVEIPSHLSGTVTELIAKEGSILKVGAHLLNYDSAGQTASTSSTPKQTPSPSSTPQRPQSPAIQSAASSMAASVSGSAQTSAVVHGGTANHTWIRSSPAVRKRAKELGINLNQIQASGNQGRILMNDVLNFRSQPSSSSGIVTQSKFKFESYDAAREKRSPVRGLRKAISKAMTLSKFTAPHFTYVDELDVTKLVKLRNYAKELGAKKNIKITFLPFYIKAVCAALREFPMVNASLDESTQEIVLKDYINIGIATATPEGLMVPNVKNADTMSIFQLAREITEKTQAAINGKSKLEDLKHGTFTLTNIGSIGGLFATPIINYPEVAIMGLYKIVKRPVISGKKIVGRDMTYISVSLDHRVVDGALAAQFTNHVIRLLETPELLLLSEDL